uniref:Uncharacterized protein n=1 Tax=Aureoumbra lagunensis TaxID=44058 RepID=A0A7S3NGN2_9STRA|mmetsp:Transcript_1084/g.1348  ORF Transcript_1084/g.1348 Transcript_1084/m.1348 type:complete len:110 (+) Transcript_1084:38-367(+)|eukprot:CAMPEP_0197289374 /NCGR_PEP_ID=MMETSP0890-20130614/6620_1 /TAXON_ID=44058 ORGANISM="Aureoumbra lagunensis, Strain CCMP1510" /NCGR_SAMPLE_ID=MMETSP0890 /ASSEMBLY_ACC=CAM_ASM_000533 /LENGTH=109 /DNA_ID=CAMNT_0042760739 /DNA_START=39 /DNA_END=368 /DNA_ORIENTATION=-
MKFTLALCLVASVAAFTGPQSSVRPIQAPAVQSPVAPAALAGVLPAVLAAQPAGAALPDVAGVPGALILTGFPLIVAATVALLVIGPGALQQLQRVFSGQSSKYMKGDY